MLKPKAAQIPLKRQKKYLLLDILLGVSVALVVAALGYMVLNPDKEASDLRNAQRNKDITNIATIVANYVQKAGSIPASIRINRVCADYGNEICKTNATNCDSYVNLSEVLNSNTEAAKIGAMPTDALTGGSDNGTGYYISQDGNGNILVCAPHAERNATISVKRFVY